MSLLKFLLICLIITLELGTINIGYAKNNIPKTSILTFGVINGYQNQVAYLHKKKSKLQYRILTWDGTLQTLQELITQKQNSIDFLLLDQNTANKACIKKLLLHRSKDLSITKNICTTPYITDYITLAWDSRKLNFTPNWKDFWNITQYPGKRGLQKDAISALSIALMADNVPADKVTAALSSPQGVKRAFRKLSQLRPYIVWWTTPNDATLLLKNNHVLMSSASALNIQHNTSLKKMPPLQIQTDYILENNLSWGIPINIKPSKKQQMLENYSIKSLRKTNVLNIHGKSIVKEDIIFLQLTQPTLENQFDQWLFLTNTSHNNNKNQQNPLD